jgi:Polyketide cyclase / dehydrase and lipid transport
MIKIALYILVLCLIVLFLYVLTRPSSFRLERRLKMRASPEKIFPLINNFRNWKQWSPYDSMDPNMLRTYSGEPEGVGCVYEWHGDPKSVGEGRMQIVASDAPHNLLIELDFLKPFEAHNMAEFSLIPMGEETRVSWAMFGDQSFTAKFMSLFFNMEKMVGPQFEEGLENLKAVVEAK